MRFECGNVDRLGRDEMLVWERGQAGQNTLHYGRISLIFQNGRRL